MSFRRRLLARFGRFLPQPQTNGRIYINAPIAKITIERDAFGFVYLFAESRKDLFFGQGWVHAQERLWQMELNRRAAHGTLSELFGKRTLQTDRIARTLGFARLAETTLNIISQTAVSDLKAYSAGVNAFITGQNRRPFEFKLLNHTPEPWKPIDSLAYGRLQMWALTTGASSEPIYAQLIQAVGEEKASEWALQYPDGNPLTLSNLKMDFSKIQMDPMFGQQNSSTHYFLGKGSNEGRGSNGWVVDGTLSQSGSPLLANDMHLPVNTPSTWHVQHLESQDGFKAAGFTQPGLPYVMIGHNKHIAWGATMAYTDDEDLFIEEFDHSRPNFYRHKGQWLEAKQVDEVINVRGAKPHLESVVSTMHGPIISSSLVEASSQYQLALSSAALIPELTMDGFGLLNDATNWSSFQTAVSRIQAPALNLLYADKQGNSGYALTGKHPIRAKSTDGTLPNEGWHGQHDWHGFIPNEQMPSALNPATHKIISANNKIVAEQYPHDLGKMWRNGYRSKRIALLLDGETAVTPEKCRQIQMDTVSIPAQMLCTHLKHLKTDDPLTQSVLSALMAWDYQMSSESIEATMFQTWVVHLVETLQTQLPTHLHDLLLGLGPHENFQPVNDFQGQLLVTLINMLNNPDSQWIAHEEKDSLLLDCLRKTAVSLQHHFGSDKTIWRWGQQHRTTLKHALGVVSPLNKLLNVGPVQMAGDGYTIQQTSMHPPTAQKFDFQNNAISVSTRMIVDLSDWNNFQLNHAPGQSGRWHSKHYDDLVDFWQNGRLLQLPWDKKTIKSKVTDSLLLLPQKRNFP